MDLLVVSAWEPELERFRALAPASPAGVRIAGGVGVGLVESAVGTTRLLAAEPGGARGLLFLGTCGAFPGTGLGPGDVVVVRRATLGDASVLAGAAALPGPMPAEVLASAELLERFGQAPGVRAVTAVTTVGISTDDALASALATAGEIEHLEAFAVGRACASASPPVPFVAVLGVANPVGREGRAAWRAHHLEASARAAEVAAAVLFAA